VHFAPPSPLNKTFVIPSYGAVTAGLSFLNVSGLDTFTNITLLDPTGDYSFTTGIGMDAFNASVGIYVEVDPVDGGMVQGGSLREDFSLDLSLRDVHFLLRLLLAVDKNSMSHLTVYQMFSESNATDSSSSLPCALSTLVDVNATSLSALLHLKSLRLSTPPSMDPSTLESELDHLVDDLLLLFVSDYNELVTDMFYGLLQGPVRDMLNGFLAEIVEAAEDASCPATPQNLNQSFVHFDESELVETLDTLINEQFGTEGVNEALQCTAEFIAASGALDGTLFEFSEPDLGIYVAVKDLTFGEIGNFYEFQMFVPEIDHYKMRNDIGFGTCSGKGDVHDENCHPFQVGVTVDVQYDKGGIKDSLNVSFAVGDLLMHLGTSVMLDKNAFAALTIPSLGNNQCLLSAFQDVSLYTSAAHLGAFEAQLHARLHSSADGDGEERHLDRVFNNTSLVEIALQEVLVVVQNMFNSATQDALYGAPYLCAGDPIPSPDDSTTATPLWKSGIAMILYVALVLLAFFVYAQKYRGRRPTAASKGKDPLDPSDPSEPLLLDMNDPTRGTTLDTAPASNELNMRETSIWEEWEDSLMWDKSVPCFIRFAIPMVLIGTMALFLASNLGVGAGVSMKLLLGGGQTIEPPPLFSFSLGNSVHDMWAAGVYPLSMMIALFSGVWPYTKLMLMLFAWMSPKSMCSISKRETLLMWLDALGKYSLVDAYVLVLMMVAFRFHIDLSNESVVVDVLVTPQFGFYGFLLGTMISLAMGHIVLAFHRHAVADYAIPMGGRSESLMGHVFVSQDGRRFKLSYTAKILSVLTIVAAIILLGIGVCTDSFNFLFKGAAGLVLGDKAETSYSLLSLGEQIPLSVEDPDDFGIRWIEITYYVFALGMPFGCLGVMAAMFVVPLTTRSASRLYVLAEVANAWSAMEVFVISVVAALLEIEQFAGFIIGDKCDGINKILEAFLDKPLHGDDKCFDVVATLGPESWYLFTGAALSSLVSFALLRLGHIALEDRYEKVGGGGDEADGLGEKGQFKKNFVNVLYASRLKGLFYVDVGGRTVSLIRETEDKVGRAWGAVGGQEGEEGEDGEDGEDGGGIYASSMIRGPRGKM
jgi:hypothetical protein